ncbi:MAG: galactosyldiacylglycerol synthase, partial [Clostridia bacterium]|nr:galactosyldiacylglycerol synthase [Clostridia bacterium]
MNILILSATTGAGHMRASQALKKYIEKHQEDVNVEIVDALEYISHVLKKTVTEGYKQMVKKAPKVFASIYKSTNKDRKMGSFVPFIMGFISRWIMPVIKEFNPDIIVTTHPFNAEMISNLRESKKIDIPHLCILTDYAPHLTWINKNVDSYVVASNDMVELMVKMGVDKNIVHPFGIPVDMAFYSYHDKESIMSNINFDPKLPTILIMAGSFGVNDILNIYDNIVEIDY